MPLIFRSLVVVSVVLVCFNPCVGQESAQKGITRTLEMFLKAAIKSDQVVSSFFDVEAVDCSLREAAKRMDIDPTEEKGSRKFLENLEWRLAVWSVRSAHWTPLPLVDENGKASRTTVMNWAWRSLKVLRIKEMDQGTRAVVSVSIQAKSGDLHALFKMVNIRSRWKIHDCCLLDEGLWISDSLAPTLIAGIHLTEERKTELAAAVNSIQSAGRILIEKMPVLYPAVTEILAAGREQAPPAVMAACLDLFEGILKSRTNRPDEALRALRRAGKAVGGPVLAHRVLGMLEQKNSDPARAAVSFYRFADSFDGEFGRFNETLSRLMAAGKTEETITALEMILAASPSAPGIAEKLIPLLVQAKKGGRVAKVLCAAIKTGLHPREPMLQALTHLGRLGANKALMDVAEACDAKSPQSAAATAARVLALRRQGKDREASAALESAKPASNDPDVLLLERQRAFTLAQGGQDAAALGAAKQVSDRLTRPDFQAFVEVWIQARKGQTKAAVKGLRKTLLVDLCYLDLLRHEPAFRRLRHLKSGKRLLVMAGKTERYVADSERLRLLGAWEELKTGATKRLARLKRDRWANDYKGMALEGLGRKEKAIDCYRKAAKICPRASRPDFKRRVVLLLLAVGRKPEALAEASALVAAYPANPTFLLLRARVHLASGGEKKALVDLKAALASAPDLARTILAGNDWESLTKNAAAMAVIQGDPNSSR